VAQQKALNDVHAALRAKLAVAEAAEAFDACELLVNEAAATPRTLLEAVRMAERAAYDLVSHFLSP
jgi:hypothetical protein